MAKEPTTMQTLDQALHLGTSGKSVPLSRAMACLIGLPLGGWPETKQARRNILDALPARGCREYNLGQFIEAAYTTDHADRYRSRFL